MKKITTGNYVCGHCGTLDHESCRSEDICLCSQANHYPSRELALVIAGGLVSNPSDPAERREAAQYIRQYSKEMGYNIN